MVNQLIVRNFKSIKSIELFAKKVNVFIGDPNSGKSNIIEALSLISQGAIGQTLSKEVFRYTSIADLFFDFNINKPIELFTNEFNYWLKYAVRQDGVPENEFNFEVSSVPDRTLPVKTSIRISHDGKIANPGQPIPSGVRYYQYKRLSKFQLGYLPHLAPPFGDNLPSLLLSNESLRNWVEEFFESIRFTLTLKPSENEISMSKLVNKSIYSYPYLSISETLQRVVFYIMAIKSNRNSVLLLDEPESNTFPFYTKFLAERIALDDSNQFFITTHNPYLLLSLIEKTPLDKINVNLVRMSDNYETQVITLSNKQIEEVLDFDSDVFFNLDRILG
jgi:AAA15 family ATPase/GTPase